jgi:transposase
LLREQIDWETISAMNDDEITVLLRGKRIHHHQKRLPDFAYIHREMQRRHVTLHLLWEEYCLADPASAYSYAQFTHYYRRFVRKLDITMRKVRRAGESVFVDFAGKTIPWIDRQTGEEHQACIFVAVLGASSYTFAYAVPSQSLPFWIEANIRMLEFFGGVPLLIVPDNLKSAVIHAGREPVLSRPYLEYARHYEVVIDPARPAHPRDKAPAETGVLLFSRLIARLRHRKFFSIEEINAAIAELLVVLNTRPYKRIPGECRRSRFEALDKPRLRPLPTERFQYAEWVGPMKVGLDYHIPVKGHHYSVPYVLIHALVEARIASHTVEIFHKGRRIASHVRSHDVGGHTTHAEHQPTNHRYFAERSPARFIEWAKTIGSGAVAAVEHQFTDKLHPNFGMRVCSTLQRLAKEHGPERFEAACCRAQAIGSLTLTSIRSILRRKLTEISVSDLPVQVDLPLDHNVRGPSYYTGGNR